MGDCYTCEYATRDKKGRYLRPCAGYGNCDYVEYEGQIEPWPIEKMKMLLEGTKDHLKCGYMSDDWCSAYAAGIDACIEIMEQEKQ